MILFDNKDHSDGLGRWCMAEADSEDPVSAKVDVNKSPERL